MKSLFKAPVTLITKSSIPYVVNSHDETLFSINGAWTAQEALEIGQGMVDLINNAARPKKVGIDPHDLPEFLKEAVVRSCPPELLSLLKNPIKLGFATRDEMLSKMPKNLRTLVDIVLALEDDKKSEPELPKELQDIISMFKSKGASVSVRKVGSLEELLGLADRLLGDSEEAPHPIKSFTVADVRTKNAIKDRLIDNGHSYGDDPLQDGGYVIHTCPCGEEMITKDFGPRATSGGYSMPQ